MQLKVSNQCQVRRVETVEDISEDPAGQMVWRGVGDTPVDGYSAQPVRKKSSFNHPRKTDDSC